MPSAKRLAVILWATHAAHSFCQTGHLVIRRFFTDEIFSHGDRILAQAVSHPGLVAVNSQLLVFGEALVLR
jgi:hypothetical protein